MKIEVNDKSALLLVNELIQKIEQTGFGAMSKNDIYDFLLYLLNKYSGNHFLENNTNFENALFLKIPESKLKNSKMNINLKFKENNDCNTVIANFLSRLTVDKLKQNESKDGYVFILDDNYTRMCIESVLKKDGDTLDYRINPEKVEIKKDSLHKFLRQYQNELDNDFRNKEKIDFFKSVAVELAKSFVPSDKLVDMLSKAASKVLSKFQ